MSRRTLLRLVILSQDLSVRMTRYMTRNVQQNRDYTLFYLLIIWGDFLLLFFSVWGTRGGGVSRFKACGAAQPLPTGFAELFGDSLHTVWPVAIA